MGPKSIKKEKLDMKIRLRRIRKFQQLASAQSRSVLIDQGVDRGGEDIGFRPTELWLIGLSSCSVTTMTRYAEQQGYPVQGIEITAEDHLDDEGYITAITFKATIEGEVTAEQKTDLLTHVRYQCKLLRTVNPSIQIEYIEADTQPQNASCTLEGGNCCL
jgi:putative redox protein